jgi:hypothetical protein
MTENPAPSGCAVCGTDRGPFEEHHVAGRHNIQSALVRLCTACHHLQTSRQWDTGVFQARDEKPDGIRILWGFVDGVSGVLIENAHHSGVTGEMIEAQRRMYRAAGQFLGLIAEEEVSTEFGPDPIANDRRRVRNSARKRGAPARPSRPVEDGASPDPSSAIDGLTRGIFPALAAASGELLDGSPHAGFVDDTRLIAVGAPQMLAGLQELEHHERLPELVAAMQRDRETMIVALTPTAGEPNLDGLRAFVALERPWLDFFRALATCEDAVFVGAALNRFLDGRGRA